MSAAWIAIVCLALMDGGPEYVPFVYELEYNTVDDGYTHLDQVIFRTSTRDVIGWRNQNDVKVFQQVRGGLFDAAWAPVPVEYRLIRWTVTPYDAEVLFRTMRVDKEGKPIVRRGILP